MKQALVFGCGSKNGTIIIETLLSCNFSIINVGSTEYVHKNVNNIKVNWHEVNIEFIQKLCSHITGNIDFVFFNQNSSSLSSADFNLDHDAILDKWKLIKDWSQSQWLSCQMPFLVLHTIRSNLHENSKIGWMLSSFIDYRREDTTEHPDYSSFKYFNYLSMQCFGNKNKFKTFGIFPDFGQQNSQLQLQKIIHNVINNDIDNKKIYSTTNSKQVK